MFYIFSPDIQQIGKQLILRVEKTRSPSEDHENFLIVRIHMYNVRMVIVYSYCSIQEVVANLMDKEKKLSTYLTLYTCMSYPLL